MPIKHEVSEEENDTREFAFESAVRRRLKAIHPITGNFLAQFFAMPTFVRLVQPPSQKL